MTKSDRIDTNGTQNISEIDKLIHSILSKENLPHRWKESVTAPIYTKTGKGVFPNTVRRIDPFARQRSSNHAATNTQTSRLYFVCYSYSNLECSNYLSLRFVSNKPDHQIQNPIIIRRASPYT